MNAQEAAVEAVRAVWKLMEECKGSELEVMKEFSEALGTEVDGMDMRIQELNEEGKARKNTEGGRHKNEL